MVKLEDIPVDASVTWTEEILLNDANVAKVATVDTLLAVQHNHTASDITDLQALLDAKVDENSSITPATKTKVTYDAKGLVTSWTDATVADISGLQTALDAKASLAWWTFTGDISVPDEAYGSGWNASVEVPTKNAVYDKVEASTWNRATKTAITTRTSTTTLANDPDVQFAVSANTKYSLRWKIYFTSDAAADFKFSFAWPATPTLLAIGRRVRQQTTTTYESILTDVVYWTSVTALTISGQVNIMEFDWILHNWANAGTFAVQWSQNTSSGNATSVQAWSYVEYIVT